MSTVLAPRSKVEVDRIVATISRETKKITQSKKRGAGDSHFGKAFECWQP